jgi:hypothetical protein
MVHPCAVIGALLAGFYDTCPAAPMSPEPSRLAAARSVLAELGESVDDLRLAEAASPASHLRRVPAPCHRDGQRLHPRPLPHLLEPHPGRLRPATPGPGARQRHRRPDASGPGHRSAAA